MLTHAAFWRLIPYLVFLIAVAVKAQTPNATIQDTQEGMPFSGSPTFMLAPQVPGARAGAIWILKNDAGLVIDGSVKGPSPEFPKSRNDLMKSEHVELWLSLVPDPQLPPLGWGHQFGDELLLNGEESCSTVLKDHRPQAESSCRSWAKVQIARRRYLRRLFTRQWQMAPAMIAETFSRPAYERIAQMGGGVDDLEPKGSPTFTAVNVPGGGYKFHVVIPWQAFPPSAKTTIQDVAILIEVFSKAPNGRTYGPYSTTSPGRRYGEANTFNVVRLKNPRAYEISPCAYDVVGVDMLGKIVPGYFFPGSTPLIESTFIAELNRAGYQYQPQGPSPRTRVTHFFSLAVDTNVSFCGPILRYRDDHGAHDLEIHHSKQEREASLGELGPSTPIFTSKEGFAVRKQPDGQWLIKSGPRTYFSEWGSGQCGACPRAALQIYSLRPPNQIDLAFEKKSVVDCQDVLDMKLSAEWQKIFVYAYGLWRDDSGTLRSDRKWQDTTYCLSGSTYEACATQVTPAPLPHTLQFPACTR